MLRMSIFAALRVEPPLFIAPATTSKIFRKDITPLDFPPPERGSPFPLRFEKFEPVPEPCLNTLASLSARSMRNAADTVSIKQSYIEPLRRVWSNMLMQQHISSFIVERSQILFARKVSVFLSPPSPTADQPVHHLLKRCFPSKHLLPGCIQNRISIPVKLRNTPLPEIFLRKNVNSGLRPEFWNLDIFHLEYNSPVRVL